MRHYEGGTTHLRLLHRRLQHGTSLPVLHQCPWRDIDGTLPNTPHVSIQSPTWLNYKGKGFGMSVLQCVIEPLAVRPAHRRGRAEAGHSVLSTLCRLRDAKVIDSYTAEYCRENCSAVLGEHPQSRVCFRPPKVSGLLLWAVIMTRRKNKKIQVYGKGTAPPIL